MMMFRKEHPADIIIRLREMDLALPKDIVNLCKDVYNELERQNPEYFSNKRNKVPDEEVLLGQNIYGLFYSYYELPYNPDHRHLLNGYAGALRILEDPKMRRAVQAMALAKITDEETELMLNARYDLNYGPEDIIFYLENFFNVKKWRLPQLRDLVEEETDESFSTMYLLALKGDKGYLLWKLGLSPNRSYQEMLQDMMNDSFYLFKENSKSGKADHDLAYKWSQVALKVAEKLERSDKEESDAQQFFQSIEFNLQSPDAPKTILKAEDLGDDLPEFNLKTKGEQEDIPVVDPEKAESGTTKFKGLKASKNMET